MIKQNFYLAGTLLTAAVFSGCGGTNYTAGTGNVNSNVNSANTNTYATNTYNSNSSAGVTVTEAREPAEYQAKVTVRIEATGEQRATAFPTLAATVARGADSRRMEFMMPAGGRVVFLDRGGKNYLVLPDRNQYAELDRQSLGFEVRRLLMPDQLVDQARNQQGVVRVGEEAYQGRQAVKYRYAAVADTQSPAGNVATESFLWVDKETGLPLHSETVSRSESGANVQGYRGLRIITDITDISTTVSPDLFAEPTGYEKIQSEQVRAQVDMIFSAVGALLMQALNSSQQPAASPTPAASGSPVR